MLDRLGRRSGFGSLTVTPNIPHMATSNTPRPLSIEHFEWPGMGQFGVAVRDLA